MAIAGNNATNGFAAASTSLTVSHNCSAGSNVALFSAVECQAGDNVTGVTYNGASMTQVGKLATGVASYENYIYSKVAPTSGANNIVVSCSGSRTLICLSKDYTGVDQTTPAEAYNSTSTTGSPGTVSVTTLTNNAWIFGTIRVNASVPTSNGTNTVSVTNSASDVGFRLYDSNAALTPAGSYSLNWNFSSSQLYGAQIISIKPAGAAVINGAGFLLMM